MGQSTFKMGALAVRTSYTFRGRFPAHSGSWTNLLATVLPRQVKKGFWDPFVESVRTVFRELKPGDVCPSIHSDTGPL